MTYKNQESRLDKLFYEFIFNIESYIKNYKLQALGYSEQHITQRLSQRFSELELHCFKRKILQYLSKGENALVSDKKTIVLTNFRCNVLSGQTFISFKYFSKSVLKFLIQWHLILIVSFLSLFSIFNRDRKKYTLVYGVSETNFSGEMNDINFIEFCRKGPLTPLNKATSLIIEGDSKNISSEPKYICYNNNPLFSLLSKKGMTINEFTYFLLLHLKSALLYFRLLFKLPLSALLNSDFAYHSLATTLNKHAIENILITVSKIFDQPLWMSSLSKKKYHLHMAWYSQNPLLSYSDKVSPILCPPSEYRNIRVDETWVWSNKFANLLKSIDTPGVFHCVGPILWYLPIKKQNNMINFSNKHINICIFDITPLNDEWAKIFGFLNDNSSKSKDRVDYNVPSTSLKFIEDILSVVDDLSNQSKKTIKILLKHKRQDHSKDDRKYMHLINGLSHSGKISMVSHDSNLYSVISKSDMVIVFPFSTPALVADYLGVPAVYYDSTESLMPIYDEANNIKFASGRKDLSSQILNSIDI